MSTQPNGIDLKWHQESRMLLYLLLAADLMYMAFHVLSKSAFVTGIFPALKNDLFSISQDLGAGEGYLYAKELWIVILFGVLFARLRRPAYLGFSAVFASLLADDMLSFHELAGQKFAAWLGYAPTDTLFRNLRYQDLGEALAMACVGGVFVILVLFAHFRGDRDLKEVVKTLSMMVALLAFCGIGLDLLSRLFAQKTVIKGLFTLGEDGGEKIFLSVICWYLSILAHRARASRSLTSREG